MLELPFTTREPPTNLAQGMRPSHLAKQHRKELAPTGEVPRVSFGLVLPDRALEPPRENSFNTCEKMLHTFIGLSLL